LWQDPGAGPDFRVVTYDVRIMEVDARPTAVVGTATTWQRFPIVWKELLDEVWACLRAGGVHGGSRNVMLYLDDVPNVEVGVQLAEPCPLTGRVVASTLPAGRVAMAIHRGSYAGLQSAHQSVLDWCAANGERVSRRAGRSTVRTTRMLLRSGPRSTGFWSRSESARLASELAGRFGAATVQPGDDVVRSAAGSGVQWRQLFPAG
jgi:effector-binding domain-containing protein